MSLRSAFACVMLLAMACERAPAPAPKPTEPAKGLPEINRAKAGVENVEKATEQRTDDALDRATKGEQVDRGTVPR